MEVASGDREHRECLVDVLLKVAFDPSEADRVTARHLEDLCSPPVESYQ